MKFKIINRTQYQTRHLRAYVTRSYAAARQLAGGRAAWYEANYKYLVITFARSNRRGTQGATGHAYYHRPKAHVGLGDNVDPYAAAYVIAHEIAHCFGMKHPEMSGGALMTHDREVWQKFYPWAGTLPLDKVVPKPKKVVQKSEKYAAELAKIAASEKAWTTRLRRAQTALKKLKQRRAYYERAAQRACTEEAQSTSDS